MERARAIGKRRGICPLSQEARVPGDSRGTNTAPRGQTTFLRAEWKAARPTRRVLYLVFRSPLMRRLLRVSLIGAPALAAIVAFGGQQQRPLKVFISVDMEGLAGVTASSDVSPSGPDYAHFRAIMAAETNAAIEGAARAGATEFVVRDSHGSKTNLLPGDVSPRAQLIRGASTGPKNMMEGI